MVTDLHFGSAVNRDSDTLKQFLGEAHHPVIVLILYVQLHTGELRIMVAVHTFVAEVTTNLVHALKTTYDKPFKIEFGCNTQVHIYVQRVMMRDERTS